MRTIFQVRCSKNVNVRYVFSGAVVINAWESPVQKFPGENVPAHIADLRETTLWVDKPNTFLGLAKDHNQDWPGSSITVINPDTNEVLISPLDINQVRY